MSFLKILKVSFKKSIANVTIDHNYLINHVLLPILTYLVFYYINKTDNYNPIKLAFAVALMSIWSQNIFYCSFLIIREREQRTLESLVTSNYSLHFLFLSEIVLNIIFSIVSVISIFVVDSLMRRSIEILSDLPLFIIAYVVSIIAIATLGLMLSILLTYTRSIRSIINIIEYPLYLVSGLFIPISTFPEFVQNIAAILPTTYAFKMVDTILEKNYSLLGSELLQAIMAIVVFQIITGFLFFLTHKKILNGNLNKF